MKKTYVMPRTAIVNVETLGNLLSGSGVGIDRKPFDSGGGRSHYGTRCQGR